MPNIQKFDALDINYVGLLEAAKGKILSTRIRVAKVASQEQINLYWWFGQQIVRTQEEHGWGKSVVEQLAADLKKSFKGTTAGFSPQNLWYMRQFYLEYKDQPNLQQVVGEIGWGQNISGLFTYLNPEYSPIHQKFHKVLGHEKKLIHLLPAP